MYYTTEPGKYPDDKPVSTEGEFFGDAWSVRIEDGKYWLQYVSAALAGRLKKVEITEADAKALKEGLLNLDQVCIKYDLN